MEMKKTERQKLRQVYKKQILLQTSKNKQEQGEKTSKILKRKTGELNKRCKSEKKMEELKKIDWNEC